jgi:hypothetical protein
LLFKYKRVSKINSLETYNAVLIDLNSEQQKYYALHYFRSEAGFLLRILPQTYVKILIGTVFC